MPRDTWWNLPLAKRTRVLRAAMREFGGRGFSAGSLNAVARDAGIAKGSLFQYFDDKLDLFATVCESVSQKARTASLATVDLDGDEPFFTVLGRVLTRFLDHFQRHPLDRGIALAAANEMNAEVRAAVRGVANAHYLDALRPLTKRAVDRGEFRPGTDPDQVVAMVILLFRHLDAAPFHPHLDPVLGLYEKSPQEVRHVALDLLGALERAYARPNGARP